MPIMAETRHPYQIVIEGRGPIGTPFMELEDVLAAARELEAVGHIVRVITRGAEVLEWRAICPGEEETSLDVILPDPEGDEASSDVISGILE
jgi:hypothetical protein